MQKRPLGRTGIDVTEVGFGAWQLSNARDWSAMTSEEAVRLVHRALELGCNFFDTAPNYGGGTSQTILGRALRGKRDQVVLNTKFGHHADGTDYSPARLRPSVEASLQALQTDHLDGVLLHNPPEEFLNGAHPIYPELERLKAEGKIRYYGSSVDSSRDMLEVIRTTKSQVLEVLFNVFHQETAAAFAEAQQRGVGLVIKVPLDSGWLSGKYTAESRFEGIRSRWSPAVIQRRAELLSQLRFLTEDGRSMTQAALAFILGFPEVSTVIPGPMNEGQLRENFSASGHPLSEDVFRRVIAFWEQHLQQNPLPW